MTLPLLTYNRNNTDIYYVFTFMTDTVEHVYLMRDVLLVFSLL